MTDLDQKAWAEAVRHVHDGNPLWIALADNALSTEGARALVAAYLAALPPSPAVVPSGWEQADVLWTVGTHHSWWKSSVRNWRDLDPIAKSEFLAIADRLSASPSPPALDGAGREGLDRDEQLGITQYLLMQADIEVPDDDWPECVDLCDNRVCGAVGCLVSKYRRVRALKETR